MELTQKEAYRTDGPADEELISACMDLMERLQGREHVEDEARITALNQRIAEAIQKKQQSKERRHTAFRTIGAIAAVLVLIVGIGVPLRWTWFESWSTSDEQQHVIMGHEITVDMVASAIAENEAKEPIVVTDFSEFEEHLGFNPDIPTSLGESWVADNGSIRFFSKYIKISAVYQDIVTPERVLFCSISYYDDVDYAYFSFEQSREGESILLDGEEIYVSSNNQRYSATWYKNSTVVHMVSKLYEDYMAGSINESNFNMMLDRTQKEQKRLTEHMDELHKIMDAQPTEDDTSQQWFDLITQYKDITELDADTLNRLINQIVVFEEIDADHVRHLRVDIHFNFQLVPGLAEYTPKDQRPYLHPDHTAQYAAQ